MHCRFGWLRSRMPETLDPLALNATELVTTIRTGRISVAAVVEACLSRIAARDTDLGAFITVCEAEAREAAAAADLAIAQGRPIRPLEGIPVAIKDNTATSGIRTTFGSKIFEHYIPRESDLVVERLVAAGAIVVGKTNTPEFACGAQCTNTLRGPTRNPWNLAYSSGGSSGGSAAAVADHMVPVAQGTDFGGSVRTPASFCGIIGLRPTPGRIPAVPKQLAWDTLNTHGILARKTRDAECVLAAISGPDARDPVSLAVPAWQAERARRRAQELRVAYSPDLGFATVHTEVRGVIEAGVERLRGAGYSVAVATPEIEGAREAFETLRAAHLYHAYRKLCEDHRELCSTSFLWNVEQGAGINMSHYLAATQKRTKIYQAFTKFFEQYDVLLTASTTVPPFRLTQQEVLEIESMPMENIIDYLRITYAISLVGFPALSMPCGFTSTHLPVGMQIISRPYDEATLIRFGHAIESITGFGAAQPPKD